MHKIQTATPQLMNFGSDTRFHYKFLSNNNMTPIHLFLIPL